MAKDEDTGIDPASKDGEGATDDELAKRRQGRGGSSASRAEEEQARLDAEDAGGTGEEDDGQLFVWEQGRKVTLGTLIARGTPVEHAFVFGGKRLKGRGALMGFEEDALVVVRGRVDKVSVVPTRDDDEKVTKATIATHIASKTLVNADSDEAMGMLAGILDGRGYVKTGEAA